MVQQRVSIKDFALYINGNKIAGGEEATATLTNDNEEAYEADNYKPVEIVEGKKHVAGTLTLAWVNNDRLKELAPNTGIWPSFTLVGSLTSGKTPSRGISLIGCSLDSIDINSLGLDSYAKQALAFKAVDWAFD